MFLCTQLHIFAWYLWGLKAVDYKKLDFKEQFGNLLRAYYVDAGVISAYLYDCGDITVAKNTDYSATAQLDRNAKFFNNEQALRMVIMLAYVSCVDGYCDAISGYGRDILLVGIHYDEKEKKHSCQIEKFAYNQI